MKMSTKILLGLVVVVGTSAAYTIHKPVTTSIAPAQQSSWVTAAANGQLTYKSDTQGNQIPDFSYSGYGNGSATIPDVPVVAIIAPQGTGDDTKRIQNTIDSVSQSAGDVRGIRGAILLKAGEYRLSGTLNIQTGGIVLRGEGDDANGTILVGEGSSHTLVNVQGTGEWAQNGQKYQVADNYVAVGATSFNVDSAAGLAVNDHIIVQRPITDNWIHTIGMDNIPPRPDGTPSTQWSAGQGILFDRKITSIAGNQIAIDVPLTDALEKQYADSVVWRYTFPGRIAQVGIENIRADAAAFGKATDYQDSGYFQSVFANMNGIENGWIRNVVLEHFGSGVVIDKTAKWITVNNVQDLDMLGSNANGQPVAFEIIGQQNLVENCAVAGDNVHAWATLSRVPGPNVFKQCTATGNIHMDAGPHERWATGTLYDNVTIVGRLAIENRTWKGTGQGWAGANNVLWNAKATSYMVQSPPTSQNWAIGCIGTQETSKEFPIGIIDSPGKPVQPASLYDAQLAVRSGR